MAAIAWQALVDAAAVMAITRVGAAATVAIIATISLVVISRLRGEEPSKNDNLRAPRAAFEPKLTEKKLEDSRYSS